MFNPEQVAVIRRVAQALINPNTPSKAVLEGLVERASSPKWPLEALCLEIDALAVNEKLAGHGEALKTLMCLFPGETSEQRTKRATALRYVNKLRGQPFWELPRSG